MDKDMGVTPSECGEGNISQTEIDAIEYLHDVVRHVSDYGQLDCTDPLVDLIESFLSEPRVLSASEDPSRSEAEIKKSPPPPEAP